MKSHVKMLYLTLLNIFISVNCYNIIVVNNFPLNSYTEVSNGIVRHLLEAGHQITYITAVSIEDNKNLNQIIYNIDESIARTGKLNISNWFQDARIAVSEYIDRSIKITTKIIKTKPVQDLLKNSRDDFDLMVAFWNFNELISGVAAIFECPIMWVSMNEPNKMALNKINVMLHADNTNVFNTIVEPKTLAENLNAIVQNVKMHLSYVESKNIEGKLYSTIYNQAASTRSMKMPPYLELVSNSSMMLFSTHPSIGRGNAMPSNAKFIGGVHLGEHEEPLPKDLMKVIDRQQNGIIYLNLGKDVDSSTLPEAIVHDLLKLFGEMKQTIFWKYEGVLTDVPSNVIANKTLPQGQILGHHNTLVFINNGELSSLNEAVHYGVPVVAIPLYLDQYFNVHLLVKKMYGLKVDFDKNLASHLKTALMTILQDSSYSTRAQILSDIYNDRILSPAEELIHWVEHVIHTKGARHLASPEYSMPWYRRNHMYFDQTILSFAIIFIIIFCSYKLGRKYCCKAKVEVLKRNKIK